MKHSGRDTSFQQPHRTRCAERLTLSSLIRKAIRTTSTFLQRLLLPVVVLFIFASFTLPDPTPSGLAPEYLFGTDLDCDLTIRITTSGGDCESPTEPYIVECVTVNGPGTAQFCFPYGTSNRE